MPLVLISGLDHDDSNGTALNFSTLVKDPSYICMPLVRAMISSGVDYYGSRDDFS